MDLHNDEFGHDSTAFETQDGVTGSHADSAAAPMMRPKPDGHSDPMGEAGWFLERERESRGESLEQVGDAIGIHPYHLEAIEFGDMTRMPPRLEALEMISAYAHYLGFDPEPLVIHYVQHLPAPTLAPMQAHPADPAPLSSAKVLFFGRMPKLHAFKFDLSKINLSSINMSKVPGGAGGVIAGCAGALMLFMTASWMMSPTEAVTGPQVAEQAAPAMPEKTTDTATAEVTTTDEKLADEQTATIDAPPVMADPAPALDEGSGVDGLGAFIAEQVPEQGKAPAGKAKTPAASLPQLAYAGDDVAQGPNGVIYGASNSNARVILKAKAGVWVRIEDSRGNVVMTQMFRAGDTYQVPDKPGMVVIARDGGLLTYSVDGVDKGLLGAPGEILVGRSLDVNSFKS